MSAVERYVPAVSVYTMQYSSANGARIYNTITDSLYMPPRELGSADAAIILYEDGWVVVSSANCTRL
jgi:hypothetical protein